MSKKIYLIAGEASGDFLGEQLMESIKVQNPDTEFFGIGGSLMQEQGLDSLFPMEELSIMGIMEVLPNLQSILKRIKQSADDIEKTNPDVVITIDAPDFCFRVIKNVRKRGLKSTPKFVHYVAPTVWAWRPKRAKKVAGFLDALICLFDFEPPYFEKEGLKAVAVGHSMMENGVKDASATTYREWTGISRNTETLGVFFGSRRGELKRIAPILVRSVEKIVEEKPDIELIIPTLPHLSTAIEDMLVDIPVKKHVISDQKALKWEIFKSCDAAIAVSGSVGLELAAANVPHLIAFKMSPITFSVLKRVIKVRFAHLANIMLNREVVPEFIQGRCKSKLITQQALQLLSDHEARTAQREQFEVVRQRIDGKDGASPSKTAAEFILDL